ncbi:LCP family protein [Bifidobacterium panos]|uniref:Transcriptional regulator n=1 Tax=Bifidobacterium panos TaxID=2675321 RepID=A0ABX1SXM9_9BIFI|nr:LCP family protein [Bifidobacterium sp. DSM 109963]NMN01526.1 transcriptional regulator [Bifidobacterium sp. DSM 109963]
MAQENEGMDPRDTPPSFVPAGKRSRQASDSAVPPSFTPSPRRRTNGAGASSQPASITPSTRSAGATPQSFTPPSSRQARSSTNSSVNKSANKAMPSRPVMARGTAPLASPTAPRQTMADKRKRIVRGLLIAIAALLIAAIAAVFCTWNWVDERLNKESGWLTDKAKTSATSWLILGSDERDGTTGGAAEDTPGFRTDTILVLTKPKNGSSSLISIPRDSLVQEDDEYMKLNAVAELRSNQQLVGVVERITGQKINHIAKIKFGGLQQVVDALDGVDLCYDETVDDEYSGLNWQAGCHVADGATALAFSRMRYSDAQGDFGRAARQRQVISAIVSKASSKEVMGNLAKVKKVAEASLSAVTVDDDTSPATLIGMALSFKNATGKDGITGSVYWTDPDYQGAGIGSTVLLDDNRNKQLFSELTAGTHAAGTVGTLAENSQ